MVVGVEVQRLNFDVLQESVQRFFVFAFLLIFFAFEQQGFGKLESFFDLNFVHFSYLLGQIHRFLSFYKLLGVVKDADGGLSLLLFAKRATIVRLV